MNLESILKTPLSEVYDPNGDFKPSWSNMGFKAKFFHITPEYGLKVWLPFDAFGEPLESVLLRDRSLFFNRHVNDHGFGLKVLGVVEDPPGFYIETAEVALDRAVRLWGVEKEHYLAARYGRNKVDCYGVLCDADFTTNRASVEIDALLIKLANVGIVLNPNCDITLTNFGYSKSGEFVLFDFDLCSYQSENLVIDPYDPQL